MTKLDQQLEQLAERMGSAWRVKGTLLSCNVGVRDRRRQDVRIKRTDTEYMLTSVVVSTAEVTQSHKKWRDLARLAWHRNAEQEIVTFAFDTRDRLIGIIKHPAHDLDLAELEVYVGALVRECDRFEYLLTGADQA